MNAVNAASPSTPCPCCDASVDLLARNVCPSCKSDLEPLATLTRLTALYCRLAADCRPDDELKAARYWGMTLALAPDHVPALLHLASLHERRGDRNEAHGLFLQAMRADPDCREATEGTQRCAPQSPEAQPRYQLPLLRLGSLDGCLPPRPGPTGEGRQADGSPAPPRESESSRGPSLANPGEPLLNPGAPPLDPLAPFRDEPGTDPMLESVFTLEARAGDGPGVAADFVGWLGSLPAAPPWARYFLALQAVQRQDLCHARTLFASLLTEAALARQSAVYLAGILLSTQGSVVSKADLEAWLPPTDLAFDEALQILVARWSALGGQPQAHQLLEVLWEQDRQSVPLTCRLATSYFDAGLTEQALQFLETRIQAPSCQREVRLLFLELAQRLGLTERCQALLAEFPELGATVSSDGGQKP
ncbi:MAG: hypothetical protein HY814_04230 [Candidatus Riflebacteria bacterium]|nr:hypothetical protein [Candidatus Riflebacteria bacterium]